MSNLSGAYVRRQEMVCTETDLTIYGDKVLLANEVIYVKMNDGTIRQKMGDGSTTVANLPFTKVFDGTVVQTTGDSETVVMSQKAVTHIVGEEKFAEFGEKIPNTYIISDGSQAYSGSWVSYKIDLRKWRINYTEAYSNNLIMLAVAFYTSLDDISSTTFISGINFAKNDETMVKSVVSEIPDGAICAVVSNRVATSADFVINVTAANITSHLYDAEQKIENIEDNITLEKNEEILTLSDVELFGNVYINANGVITPSTLWTAYKVTRPFFSTLKFSGLVNNLYIFSVAFYSTDTPVDSAFLGGAHLSAPNGTVVLSLSDVPDSAKCVLLCSRTEGTIDPELEITYTTASETVKNSVITEGLKNDVEGLKNEVEYWLEKTEENMMTSENRYAQYYISADGTPTPSYSWDSYLLFDIYRKCVFECYTNNTHYYAVGFYSDIIPSAETWLGGLTFPAANQLTTVTVNPSDIPDGTKSILFCTRTASGSSSTLTRVKTTKEVIDTNIKAIADLVSENNGRGNVKAIYKRIPNSNDFTIIKDEIWFCQNIYQDGVATEYSTIRRYKIVDDRLIHISDIDSDFGHWNTVDYCEENDCLIFTNAANAETTEGNWFCVVKNPLALGSTARIADCGIKYNVDIGFKVQAVWGDNNFGQYNIVYLTSNYSNRVVKVLLLKDENGDFNGEYVTLEDKELSLTAWASGGGDFYGDTLYIGLGIRYRLGMMSMTDYSTKEIEKHYYYADGTKYSGSTQGVHVDSKYIWVFSNVAGSSENYLIQYYR